ncbi:ferritin-like domain-containing protein [Actinomadura rudentiformis]|uniref:DNA protection protein DPS n=1 Tax=Actinomadura rudentiformis TaxID=359158 RepID=A0A6H9YZK2_9ACTN|nr:ferritin-like domain-containing protein [Actinomadura rudentiformis]KAB2346879.1 DNA protection protein DPS [Actinomadura rudentiformis]
MKRLTAREIVERAGLDAGDLVGRLTSAAGQEFATFYHYTIMEAACSTGAVDQRLSGIIADMRAEERRHFETLVERIYELDGYMPADIHVLMDLAGRPEAPNVDDESDLITALLDTERRAVDTYADLCALTEGKDHRTYRLVLALHAEEGEHEAWVREFLGEEGRARIHRGFRGRSPHVSRYRSPGSTE